MTGSELWCKSKTAPSTEKQIGLDLRGDDLLTAGIFVPGKHQPWMCLAVYSRVSHIRQQLNKLLLAQFRSLIDDETTRETCQVVSGVRFTEALIALLIIISMNPGKQLVITLNETHLSYQSLHQLAQLLLKCKAAVLHATPGQRMCFEALHMLDKGANKECDADLGANKECDAGVGRVHMHPGEQQGDLQSDH